MAAYPNFPQADGTVLIPRAGIVNRVASNGTVRARALSSATRYDPTVIHVALSASQWSQFKTFFESNRGVPFVFVFVPDGSSLSCVFDYSNPYDVRGQLIAPGVTVYNVTARLKQST